MVGFAGLGASLDLLAGFRPFGVHSAVADRVLQITQFASHAADDPGAEILSPWTIRTAAGS